VRDEMSPIADEDLRTIEKKKNMTTLRRKKRKRKASRNILRYPLGIRCTTSTLAERLLSE